LDGGLSRGFSVDEALIVEDVLFDANSIHSIEEVFEKFPTVDVNTYDYNKLKNGGFILNTKSVQHGCVLAKYRGKVVGVLEGIRDGKFVKFKKTINISA